MKDMFYNYDHTAVDTDLELPICLESERQLMCNEAVPLINIKGQCLGIRVKSGSKVPITFDISISGINYELLFNLPDNLILDIYDARHNKVQTLIPEVMGDKASVELITGENTVLKTGVYYLDLYYLDSEQKINYTLFSSKDGILSVEG